MSTFVDMLESRTLMSAVPAVAALEGEGRIVLAEGSALATVGKEDYKLIYADLKAAGELKTSKSEIKALASEGTAALNVLKRGVLKTESLIKADLDRVVAAAARLSKHPTGAGLSSKLTAAENTLSTDAANRESTVTNDISSLETIDSRNLTALVLVNPDNTQLSNDVTNTIDPRDTTARTGLENAVMTALATDVAAVLAAFPA